MPNRSVVFRTERGSLARRTGAGTLRPTGLGLAVVLVAASLAGQGWAQFIEPVAHPPDSNLVRLPPVWLETPAANSPNGKTSASRIDSWFGSGGDRIVPVAFQGQAGQVPQAPVVSPAPTVSLPSTSPPRRYFMTSGVPPRSGHISYGDAGPFPSPPDPEELDSCNLPKQHQLAMIDLMGNNELLISSGTVSPVGDQQIANHLLTGWGIQGAVRHIWCASTDAFVGFTEGGGGFWQNGGNRSYVTTSGQLVDTSLLNPGTVYLDDFFDSTLRDLRRATVHAALGGYYLPLRWQEPGVRALQFNGRLGLHWGHARATFQQTPTNDLLNTIASRVAAGSFPTSMILQSNVDLSDSYFGMFTSMGISYNRFNVVMGCFQFGEVAVGIDLQYTHDWISLKDYNFGSRGLSTLAPMASLRILY